MKLRLTVDTKMIWLNAVQMIWLGVALLIFMSRLSVTQTLNANINIWLSMKEDSTAYLLYYMFSFVSH